MSLKLGKSFDRSYGIRLPFLNGYYDIGIFFNKKSTFLLFSVDQSLKDIEISGVKVNMFKNIESSKFCETFLELHNYRKETLDILNQFKCIRPEYHHELSFLANETINLAKIDIDEDRSVFDCLNIYAFTLNAYVNEFIFVLAERQNIVKMLNRKMVRTSGLQIATSRSIAMLNDYHKERLISGKEGLEARYPSSEIIKLDEEK